MRARIVAVGRCAAASVVVALAAGCTTIKDVPPPLFVRLASSGQLEAQRVGCGRQPAPVERIELNQLALGTDSSPTAVWTVTTSTKTPAEVPDTFTLFGPLAGMTAAPGAPGSADLLPPEASLRLVMFGRSSIEAADFTIGELRTHPGRFRLITQEFDSRDQLETYACSSAFRSAWSHRDVGTTTSTSR